MAHKNEKPALTKESIEAALAILQVHHDLHGAPWKGVQVEKDGSLTCEGRPVAEETVRLWARAGYNVMVINRAGQPERFPEFEQVKLRHPSEKD